MSLGFSTTTSVVNKVRKRIYPECGRRIKRGNTLASPHIALAKKGRRDVKFSSAMSAMEGQGVDRFIKRSVKVHVKAWKLFRKAGRTFEQAVKSPVHLQDELLEKAIHFEELAKEKIRRFSSVRYVPEFSFFVGKVEGLLEIAREEESEGRFAARDILLDKAVELEGLLRAIYHQ